MPERPTVHASLRLASAAAIEKRRRLKCDRDVKLHLPEALYDDLARQARRRQSRRERIHPRAAGTTSVRCAGRRARLDSSRTDELEVV